MPRTLEFAELDMIVYVIGVFKPYLFVFPNKVMCTAIQMVLCRTQVQAYGLSGQDEHENDTNKTRKYNYIKRAETRRNPTSLIPRKYKRTWLKMLEKGYEPEQSRCHATKQGKRLGQSQGEMIANANESD